MARILRSRGDRKIDRTLADIAKRNAARCGHNPPCHSGHMPHGHCVECGIFTCDRMLMVQPGSLQRRLQFVCFHCRHFSVKLATKQDRLREQRTRHDWTEVTAVRPSRVYLDEMPEQLPGPARAALRDFINSDASRAVVPDVAAETLNNSIGVLGLSDSVYAETRDEQTVLRRV